MSSTCPPDNARRPCSTCGKPRGDSGRNYCGPCWRAYHTAYQRARKARLKLQACAAKEPAAERVPRELKVGQWPGISAPW